MIIRNRYTVYISRAVLSLVFIFSGFTKWVDPAGSQIKFAEYFHAFGVGGLEPLALPLSIVMPAAELFIGVMLALGIYKRLTAWATLLFMCFFTLLTFAIWRFVPVNDCGCFGDFITLGNGETFAKNLIIMPFAVILFLSRGVPGKVSSRDLPTALMLALWSLALPIYASVDLPLTDFLPYGEGTDIRAAMSIPDGADKGEHSTRLLYRNRLTGAEQLFEISDTTWYDDTKWEYLNTVTEVVREGYTPKIISFSAVDRAGAEHGDDILSAKGYTALVVVRSLKEAQKQPFIKNMERLRADAACGVRTVVVTQLDIAQVSRAVGDDILCLNMDQTQLKSMVRSKCGLMLLDEGTIVAKRNMLSDIPGICGKAPRQIIKAEKRRKNISLAVYVALYFAISIYHRRGRTSGGVRMA